jgi:UDP-glucuronate 4-epimerase
LGAQAGVRYSIENPMAYVNSNIVGFTNLLEQSRLHAVEHLVYASSSSVYGLNGNMPFSTHESVNHPVSFYAATKKSNELMAHVFSKLYQLPTTGLRFFTVYGPWGRPDMSPMLFADAILHGKTLKVFNNGDMGRDFTYIGDIIEGVVRVINRPATPSKVWNALSPDPATSSEPYRLYNIGSSAPLRLMDYIETLENALGKKAVKEFLPMQPGDVLNTFCDVSDLENEFGYKPNTTLKTGLAAFASWYKDWDAKM